MVSFRLTLQLVLRLDGLSPTEVSYTSSPDSGVRLPSCGIYKWDKRVSETISSLKHLLLWVCFFCSEDAMFVFYWRWSVFLQKYFEIDSILLHRDHNLPCINSTCHSAPEVASLWWPSVRQSIYHTIATERHDSWCTTLKMILWGLCTIFSQVLWAFVAETITYIKFVAK